MWELDYKEVWALKNWYFWILMLEKTLESPLDRKEIKPIKPKGNQSWIFIGSIDVDAIAPILWPRDAKCWLIGKDPDAKKYWRKMETGVEGEKINRIINSVDMNLSILWETVENRGAWHAIVHGVAKSWTQFSNWTTTNMYTGFCVNKSLQMASLVVQTVKNLPIMRETQR